MNRRQVMLASMAAAAPAALVRPVLAQSALPTQTYLMAAAKGSTFLEQTSRDAYAKTANPVVQRFAKSEIAEQVKLSAQLARASGMDVRAMGGSLIGAAVAVPFAVAGGALELVGSVLGVPLTSDAQKTDTIGRLRAMPGSPVYDGEYVNAQIIGHNEAYALHGTYAASGDDPALRRVAHAALPLIRLHLAQLGRIRASSGAQS